MSHLHNNTQLNSTNNVNYMGGIDPNTFVIREREFLFKMGDQLEGIYRVNSGSVKIFKTTEAGDDQIVRFCMPGDFIGLDGLEDGVSRSSVETLETSNLSLIPFKAILHRDQKFDYPNFIHQLGVNFNHDIEYSMMLSQCADRRLAWFLINFSDGLKKRGQKAEVFTVPMKRTDIALYLGMAVETLSRELATFCKLGLLKKYLRNIELLDIEEVRKIANGGELVVKKEESQSIAA